MVLYLSNILMLSASASGSFLSAWFGEKTNNYTMSCTDVPTLHYDWDATIDYDPEYIGWAFYSSQQPDRDSCVEDISSQFVFEPQHFIIYLRDHEKPNCRLMELWPWGGLENGRLNCYQTYKYYTFDTCHVDGVWPIDCGGELEWTCATVKDKMIIGADPTVNTTDHWRPVSSMQECVDEFNGRFGPYKWPRSYTWAADGTCLSSREKYYKVETEYKYVDVPTAVVSGIDYTSCAWIQPGTVFPPEIPTTTPPTTTPPTTTPPTTTPPTTTIPDCADTEPRCGVLITYEGACYTGSDFEVDPPMPLSSMCPATCALTRPEKTCEEWLNFRE